jgi:formyltetrahydrofolate-dependent phosphoribosylglycinamide formyltransferase
MQCSRLAVFASGGGSNFQSIWDAWKKGTHPLEPVCLLSNRAKAGALKRARAAGIDTVVFGKPYWGHEASGSEEILRHLKALRVDCIALAGFLKLVPKALVDAFEGRMVNIHPALLPAFGGTGMYGRFVHEAVHRAGCLQSGPTVHFVDAQFDRGPILLQRAVALEPGDSPQRIAERVLEVEHEIYPEALKLLAEHPFPFFEGRAKPCPNASQ